MHREHDHAGLAAGRLHLTAGLDTVAVRHGHVHEDDVGKELLGQSDGLDAVLGLAHDVETLFEHRSTQPLAEHLVVVGKHEADRVHFLAPGLDCSWGWLEREGSRMQVMLVPAPGVLCTSSVAPMDDARSRMPNIP